MCNLNNASLKLFFISSVLSILCLNGYGQITINKVHAFKMQVIQNTDGSTKGWFPCDFYIAFEKNNKELKSISFDLKGENLRVVIKKNANEKFNYSSYTDSEGIEYRWYEGFDDLSADDVRMLIGYKITDKQLKPISITLIYMLSSNYISLNYP